jgi:ribosome-associated protein
VLHLACEKHRSQKLNKDEVVSRLHKMIEEALVLPKVRRVSKPTKNSKKRRLEGKKQRGDLKKDRGKKNWD